MRRKVLLGNIKDAHQGLTMKLGVHSLPLSVLISSLPNGDGEGRREAGMKIFLPEGSVSPWAAFRIWDNNVVF